MYVCENFLGFTGQGKFQVLKKKKKLYLMQLKLSKQTSKVSSFFS
jgi:hypothetical protein